MPVRTACWLASAILAAGCQSVADRDSFGNVYPAQCRVIDHAAMTVRYLPRERMPVGPGGIRLIGSYFGGQILIAEGLPKHLHDDVLRHEACHAIAGAWHEPGPRSEPHL